MDNEPQPHRLKRRASVSYREGRKFDSNMTHGPSPKPHRYKIPPLAFHTVFAIRSMARGTNVRLVHGNSPVQYETSWPSPEGDYAIIASLTFDHPRNMALSIMFCSEYLRTTSTFVG
ncbi:hypothetical protein Tcan_18617 [Toxocara canis]|uniref:Uncharacterized protein n=1 Tax=Toxocara canis TaxID=6265 RepID=A0A0B2V1S1_TOXCA|nr:hypothetical protein Tcan_18617 [Toxocara canis]